MRIARSLFMVAAVAIGLAFSAYYALPNAARDSGIDYRVFWRAASLVDVYRPGHMPFAYPPTALVFLQPIDLLPARAGYWIWISCSAAIFAFAVAKVAGLRIAALSFLSPAAVKGLVLGQFALLLAGCAFATLLLPPLAGGLLWGVLLAVKPQLFLFAPLAFLVRRDWKTLFGMGLGVVAVIGASLLMFGPRLWLDWISALPSFHRTLVEDGVLGRVVTPAGQAEFLGYPSLPFLLAGILVGGAAVAYAAPRLQGAKLIALIVAASVVGSPYAHVHDTVALIPAMLLLIMHGPWAAAIAAAVVFAGPPGLTMIAMLLGLTGVILHSILARPEDGTGAREERAPSEGQAGLLPPARSD